MKLNLIRLIRRSNLTVPLQTRDSIDEPVMHPRLIDSFGIRGRDDIRSRLFHDVEPGEFQLTEDRRLPRPARR